jgi:hypothetical protein
MFVSISMANQFLKEMLENHLKYANIIHNLFITIVSIYMHCLYIHIFYFI